MTMTDRQTDTEIGIVGRRPSTVSFYLGGLVEVELVWSHMQDERWQAAKASSLQ